MATQTVSMFEAPEIRKRIAQEHWNIICDSIMLVHTNSLRIGFHANELKRNTLFGILGFRNEAEAQEASGVGRSTWYANIRLAEDFLGVDEQVFCSMKLSNARALADLPQSVRVTDHWVRMASMDSMKEFQRKVDKELDGRAKRSSSREVAVSLKIPMPLSRKKVIEDQLEALGERMDESDFGRILELLLEEHSQGIGLIEAIKKTLEELLILRRIESSDRPADEALKAIYGALTGIIDTLLAALEAAESDSGGA